MQTQIQIDRSVPLPSRSHVGAAPKYPFADMKPGDSFVHPGPMGTARNSAHSHKTRHGLNWKFAFAEEGSGVRIWRRA